VFVLEPKEKRLLMGITVTCKYWRNLRKKENKYRNCWFWERPVCGAFPQGVGATCPIQSEKCHMSETKGTSCIVILKY
jgi:hypothetical protein